MNKYIYPLLLVLPFTATSLSAKQNIQNGCETCFHLYNKGDISKAFRCYKAEAEKGNPIAQLNLGIFYHTGDGVEKNDVEAVKWYTMAAEQGNAEAQDRLGHCYQKHTGVEENPQKAFEWYMKAAKQGYDKALYNVGICYMGGYGVEKDVDEGMRWMKRSADTGYKPAIELVKFLETHPEKVDMERNSK